MCKDSNGMTSNSCCGCYGPQGPQGVPGLQGAQGVQGIPGQDGKPGPMGAQGPQGLTGAIGPVGSIGASGPQGAQGLQGPVGSAGQSGSPGPVGPQGSVGPQGVPGLQGIPGKDCDAGHCDCCQRYFNLYSSLPQLVGAYGSGSDAVLLDKANAVSVGDFDLSMAASTGQVTFLKHGVYHLSWQLQARITSPVPTPVPSWSFGFWVNGSLLPGSIYSGFTQAPDDDACHSTGELQIELQAGDKLILRNTSISSVNLNPNVTGSVFPITIASVNVECLKALP